MKSIRAISPTRIIELYGGTSSDLNEREGGGPGSMQDITFRMRLLRSVATSLYALMRRSLSPLVVVIFSHIPKFPVCLPLLLTQYIYRTDQHG